MTINAAPDTQNTVLGSAIRQAREGLGWTQSKLADSVGFASGQIISSIETGQRELKASELFRIAKILRTPVESLLRGETTAAAQVQWRQKSPNAGKELETKFLQRARRYRQLEEWCEISAHKPLSTLQLSPGCKFEHVQEEADKMRRYMELGGRPALSLEKTLEEDYGVKIFYDNLGDDGSGMAANGDFGRAVLLNSGEPPSRRNFSLGHELFHLLSPEELRNEPNERVEQLANVFSSQLLLPPEPIHEFLNSKLTPDRKLLFKDIVEAAKEFAVSSEAFIWRLVNMGKVTKENAVVALNNERFRALDHVSFSRSEQPSALPDRYRRLAMLTYQNGKLGLARLADYLETNIVDLADDLGALDLSSDQYDAAQVPVS